MPIEPCVRALYPRLSADIIAGMSGGRLRVRSPRPEGRGYSPWRRSDADIIVGMSGVSALAAGGLSRRTLHRRI